MKVLGLRRLEWLGEYTDGSGARMGFEEEDGSHYPACPICGGLKPNSSFEKGYFLYKMQGHKKSCWLGQALS
jgi:hypothetical protein